MKRIEILKKTLLSLLIFTLASCSDSKNNVTNNTNSTENSTVESTKEEIQESFKITPKDSSTPNLNNFVDINSKDKKKSLIYWYLANTDHDMDMHDYIRVFSPEILVEKNSFEK